MNYSSLAKSYNTFSHTNALRTLFEHFFDSSQYYDLSKFEIIKIINDTLLQYYCGEKVLMFKLAEKYLSDEYIGAFEVTTNSSRADFLAINGSSFSFEIKSKIDTLKRLTKQSKDYANAFEYNNLVTDKSHVDNASLLIPDYYGIYVYDSFQLIEYRPPTISKELDPIAQISILNKKERLASFRYSNKEDIIKNFSNNDINESFKKALKLRYQKRWKFIIDNWQIILPIDLQFFFKFNISPNLIYET